MFRLILTLCFTFAIACPLDNYIKCSQLWTTQIVCSCLPCAPCFYGTAVPCDGSTFSAYDRVCVDKATSGSTTVSTSFSTTVSTTFSTTVSSTVTSLAPITVYTTETSTILIPKSPLSITAKTSTFTTTDTSTFTTTDTATTTDTSTFTTTDTFIQKINENSVSTSNSAPFFIFYIITVVLCIVILIGGVIFYRHRNKMRKNVKPVYETPVAEDEHIYATIDETRTMTFLENYAYDSVVLENSHYDAES